MRSYQWLLYVIVSMMLGSCFHENGNNNNHDVAFDIVSMGTQTGIAGQQTRVVREADQLSSLLSQVTISGEVPNPDFSSHMLVALFSAFNSGCGDGLTVTGVKDNGVTFIVYAVVSVPGPDRVCPTLVPEDNPYVFIELPFSTKPVSVLIDVQQVL